MTGRKDILAIRGRTDILQSPEELPSEDIEKSATYMEINCYSILSNPRQTYGGKKAKYEIV